MPDRKKIQHRAMARDIRLDDRQASALADYLGLLLKWNAKMNLVGPSTWEDMFDHLILDSLHLAAFLESLNLPEDPLTLDLGAGAGIPGIPLRIFWSAGIYLMVESRSKRVFFVEQALRALSLPNTRITGSRVEELIAEKWRADVVLSRAFKPWPEFLNNAGQLLTPGGKAIIMAGKPWPEMLPPGWEKHKTMRYDSPAGSRRLWSLSANMAPS